MSQKRNSVWRASAVWPALFMILLGLCLSPAFAANLPADLDFLAPLLSNHDGFVKAMRDFDSQQKALAQEARKKALELREQGKMDEAAELLSAARERMLRVREGYEIGVAHFGRSARLHTYYGELLYDEFGERAGALRQWNLALTMDAKLGAAHNNLGLHYFHNGQYDLGLTHMEEALRLEKKNPDYLYNMTQIYLIHWPQIRERRRMSQKAVYRKAMSMSKAAAKYAAGDYDLVVDYAVNFYAAERFGVKARWARAAAAWQKSRKVARNDVERFYTWLNEGRVWLYAKKYSKAEACLQEALRMHPDSEAAKTLLQRAQSRKQPDAADM